jgi:hypothetical protein
MANYNLTRYSTGFQTSIDAALEALETQLETVDSAKTIRALDITTLARDRESCIGWVIYDT